jgi:hypothetical protein
MLIGSLFLIEDSASLFHMTLLRYEDSMPLSSIHLYMQQLLQHF